MVRQDLVVMAVAVLVDQCQVETELQAQPTLAVAAVAAQAMVETEQQEALVK